MLRSKEHNNARGLHLLKKLARVSLALLGITILILALVNLMISVGIATVGSEGAIHGLVAWLFIFISEACFLGFALLSVCVTAYATVLASEEQFVDTRRAMFWTWILPFMSAVFFFAFSNQEPGSLE